MKKESRVYLYDYLRLIATVLVVIGHSEFLSISSNLGGINYVLPENLSPFYYSGLMNIWRTIQAWTYGFHMPLFFLLSGAVLAINEYKSFDEFVCRRIRRLLIPFVLWGWFYMIPLKMLSGYYNPRDIFRVMGNFLCGDEVGYLWFLPALFWCSVVFFGIVKMLKHFKVSSDFLLLMISGILFWGYKYIPFDVLWFKGGMQYIFFFSLGYVFERQIRSKNNINTIQKFIILGGLTIIVAINTHSGFLNAFWTTIFCSAFCIALACVLETILVRVTEKKYMNALFASLFYVYLIHDPLEYVCLSITFNSSLLTTWWGCLIYVLSRTVLVFIIGVLGGYLISIIKKKCYYLMMKYD